VSKQGETISGLLFVQNGVVYVPMFRGQERAFLRAIRVSDGKLLWEEERQNVYLRISQVIDDTLYVFVTDTSHVKKDTLLALDGSSGHELWHTEVAGRDYSTLMVQGDMLYFLAQADRQPVFSTIYALRLRDGLPLWAYPLKLKDESGSASFVVVNGMVYAFASVSSEKGYSRIYALRASDGQMIWSQEKQKAILSVLSKEHTLYTISMTDVTALHENTGQQIWSYNLGRTYTVSLGSRALYLGGDQKLKALDLSTGKEHWTVATSF
jgi:outer membrane protein assembly factor BamB